MTGAHLWEAEDALSSVGCRIRGRISMGEGPVRVAEESCVGC